MKGYQNVYIVIAKIYSCDDTMAVKSLKAVCPHCNKAVQLELDDKAENNSWLLCTPLPVEEVDLKEAKSGLREKGSAKEI